MVPPLTGADTAAFADCLFLVGQAWVKRAVGDDQGAVEYLADAMVIVPDGTVEMILCMIEDRALPEPVPGAMDPWLECCRQAGAGELRLTAARFRPPGGSRSYPAAPAPTRRHLETEAALPGRLSWLRPRRTSRRRPGMPDMVRRIAWPTKLTLRHVHGTILGDVLRRHADSPGSSRGAQ
jgi:hypothetical protein